MCIQVWLSYLRGCGCAVFDRWEDCDTHLRDACPYPGTRTDDADGSCDTHSYPTPPGWTKQCYGLLWGVGRLGPRRRAYSQSRLWSMHAKLANGGIEWNKASLFPSNPLLYSLQFPLSVKVNESMATRILVQCISHEMPGPREDKNDYMANHACQKAWGRDFNPAEDRLITRGGYFLYNQPCWVIIDNGPTDAESYTTLWFKWSPQKQDL